MLHPHLFWGLDLCSTNQALGQNYLTFGNILNIYGYLCLTKFQHPKKGTSELKKQRVLPLEISLIQKRKNLDTYNCTIYISKRLYIYQTLPYPHEYTSTRAEISNITYFINHIPPGANIALTKQAQLQERKNKQRKTAVAMRLPFYPRRRSRESGSLTSFSSPTKLINKCSHTSLAKKTNQKKKCLVVA